MTPFYGCYPIEGRWANLPINVCTETDFQNKIISDFNLIVGIEFYRISKDNCQIDIEIKSLISDFKQDELARTTPEFNPSSPEIIEKCHIIILPEPYLKNESTIKAYEILLLHELGHAAGHFFHSEEGLMKAKLLVPSNSDDFIFLSMKDEFIPWIKNMYADYYWTPKPTNEKEPSADAPAAL